MLSADDLFLFNEGSHFRLYDRLGAHPTTGPDGTAGVSFAVWAPDAASVHVYGDFNDWNRHQNALHPVGQSGLWQGFIREARPGQAYKFFIESRFNNYHVEKADPFAFFAEVAPKSASVIWNLDYRWNDQAWMKDRGSRHTLASPISIYEMHLGSWRRVPEEQSRPLTYRELAEQLPPYLHDLGFTHVEFLPVMEHPFSGSWGYQTLGYFAPTSRYGTPQDFMALVDALHQHGIGVILDWVPSHFPTDDHGLAYFDGTCLYEHTDPRQGFHPDRKSAVFNYGRNEVRSFLISSALFWLDKYHIDGLRVDAVASMLYLDYSRQEGEWIPNQYGGRENLEAIAFLRRLNERIYAEHPDVVTIAEESTAWPMVSQPPHAGGLGFLFKWDMGWMHDSLRYFSKDPVYRKFHQNDLTFRLLYAFHENFVLSLSHDEVVHGKGSLLNKMPGDPWQKFANLRLLLGNMFAHAGKKLLFMGGEFGQWNEWYHETSLDWHLTTNELHGGLQAWVRDLNRLYATEPALHRLDARPEGFEWLDCNDTEHSVIAFFRKSHDPKETVLFVFNLTPVPHIGYRLGVSSWGLWRELLNSDATLYGGSGLGNEGGRHTEAVGSHGHGCSLSLTLPPLAVVALRAPR